MLRPVESRTAIVACSTCRLSAERRTDAKGHSGGMLLAAELKRVQASDPRYADIAIEEMPCLFACGDYCTLHLRAPGKISYVLGRFTPDETSARAMLDYAAH